MAPSEKDLKRPARKLLEIVDTMHSEAFLIKLVKATARDLSVELTGVRRKCSVIHWLGRIIVNAPASKSLNR
jgi:hypothetical protein